MKSAGRHLCFFLNQFKMRLVFLNTLSYLGLLSIVFFFCRAWVPILLEHLNSAMYLLSIKLLFSSRVFLLSLVVWIQTYIYAL